MTFAFDLDGTITRHPLVMNEIMLALRERSHRVVVLTAVDGGDKNRSGRLALLELADCLEGCHFDEMICVQDGPAKAQWCSHHEVDFFIDDTPSYVDAVKSSCPDICAALIVHS